MKKLLFALLALPLLTGCKEQYEKDIDAYYEEHLNDPSSYERISLDSNPQELTPTSVIILEYANRNDLADILDRMREKYEEEGKDPNKLMGYYLLHEYRAKNKFGAMIKQKDIIYLDKEKNLMSVERYDK